VGSRKTKCELIFKRHAGHHALQCRVSALFIPKKQVGLGPQGCGQAVPVTIPGNGDQFTVRFATFTVLHLYIRPSISGLVGESHKCIALSGFAAQAHYVGS